MAMISEGEAAGSQLTAKRGATVQARQMFGDSDIAWVVRPIVYPTLESNHNTGMQVL